jgi:hypothetical protein
MRYVTQRAVVCLIGLLVAGNAGAYTLVSREHGFSIELPGEPEHGDRVISIKGKDFVGVDWTVDRWTVEFLKLSAAVGPSRQFFDSVLKVEGRCRAILSQKDIRQNGLAGREAFIRDTQYTQRHGCGYRRSFKRVRVFVVRNRYYRIEYQAGADDAMRPEVTRVMDSFRAL